jgi:hypothetical protein
MLDKVDQSRKMQEEKRKHGGVDKIVFSNSTSNTGKLYFHTFIINSHSSVCVPDVNSQNYIQSFFTPGNKLGVISPKYDPCYTSRNYTIPTNSSDDTTSFLMTNSGVSSQEIDSPVIRCIFYNLHQLENNVFKECVEYIAKRDKAVISEKSVKMVCLWITKFIFLFYYRYIDNSLVPKESRMLEGCMDICTEIGRKESLVVWMRSGMRNNFINDKINTDIYSVKNDNDNMYEYDNKPLTVVLEYLITKILNLASMDAEHVSNRKNKEIVEINVVNAIEKNRELRQLDIKMDSF